MAEAKACSDTLRGLREAAAAEGGGAAEAAASSTAEILATLEKLAGLPLDFAGLRETGVGREVNDRFIRTHADAAVRDRSKALVSSWKALMLAKVASSPGSATADDAKAGSADPGTPEAEAKRKREKPPNEKKREPPAEETPKKAKSAKTADDDASSPNGALAALFQELAGFEFKKSEKFKGIAYQKVARVLRSHGEEIKDAAEAAVLPGVGKASAAKVKEYLSTGKIERLERYRSGDMEGGD